MNWKIDKNLIKFSILLGLALSTKMHILAAVPILFIYIIKKRGVLTALKVHLISLIVVTIFTIPFWCEGFIHTVLFNKEQSLLLSTNVNYGTTQILIPILVLFVVYFSVLELNYLNRNLVLSLMALLFSVFLICLPPMPAWFTWIVPFIALYFGFVENDKHKVMMLYGFFNLTYIVYFIYFHDLSYVDLYFLNDSLQLLKIHNDSVKYLVFTLMTACLGIIIFKIYKFGLATNSFFQMRDKSFVIGIAGDSGTGKSRMLEKINHLFGYSKDILFVEGDGDHRWERGNKKWEEYTALDPKANYLYRQAEDLRKLKSGVYVERKEYDHDKGIFTDIRRVKPKRLIVLSGLHSLYLPKMRELLDLKIYMDTDEELRKYWKIQRDMKERGYSKEKIIEQICKRYTDAEKYIYPQKNYADLIITYFDKSLTDCMTDSHNVVLSVKFEMNVDLNVEPMIEILQQYGINADWKLSEDFCHQLIVFDGDEIERITPDYDVVAESIIPQYEDFFTKKPIWGKDVEGIIQLLLLFVISERMRLQK